jgi:hypothetical protein
MDWNKLMQKQIAPPMHLAMEDEDENEELRYLKSMEKVKFRDKDYSKDNATLNRVKQFTFVRN